MKLYLTILAFITLAFILYNQDTFYDMFPHEMIEPTLQDMNTP